MAQPSVEYKADGRGPEILGDSNLMLGSSLSFQTAVAVATKAWAMILAISRSVS